MSVLGVSNKISTAVGMSGAVVFVMTLATFVTFIIQEYLLNPFGLGFLQTISFILVIAALVQMVEIILKKIAPPLYQALGVFLPLITTNCAVLGVAIMVIQQNYNLVGGLVFTMATALGYGLALIIFAGLREQMELANIPKAMKEIPYRIDHGRHLIPCFYGFCRSCLIFYFYFNETTFILNNLLPLRF